MDTFPWTNDCALATAEQKINTTRAIVWVTSEWVKILATQGMESMITGKGKSERVPFIHFSAFLCWVTT